MGRKVFVVMLLAGLVAMSGVASAAVYTAPTSQTYGSKTLAFSDYSMFGGFWGGGGVFEGSGNTLHMNVGSAGAEVAGYYAFKVPTGSAVAITGGQWKGVAGGMFDGWSGTWAETALWSSDSLAKSTADQTVANGQVMNAAIRDSSPWNGASAAAANRWGPAGAGAYATGFNQFDYGGADFTDEFGDIFSYFSNAQHFQTVGGPGTNPTSSSQAKNPFDASLRGGVDSAWIAQTMPTSMTPISESSYVGSGLNRIMQDSELPNGNPLWMVTSGTGADTEVSVLVKLGGTNGSDLEVSNLTFEVRGRGDANGDKKCDATDLNTVLSFYNQAGGWDHGDFNGDGLVNATDLNTVLSYYNQSYTGGGLLTATVPEPSTICLALSGLAMLLGYGVRKC